MTTRSDRPDPLPMGVEEAEALARHRGSPEKALQDQIVDALRLLGATVVVLGHARRQGRCGACGARAASYGTQQTAGVWDLLVLWPGRGIHQAAEVKTPRGRISDEQICLHLDAGRAGLPTYVLRSLDDALQMAREAGVAVRRSLPLPVVPPSARGGVR